MGTAPHALVAMQITSKHTKSHQFYNTVLIWDRHSLHWPSDCLGLAHTHKTHFCVLDYTHLDDIQV